MTADFFKIPSLRRTVRDDFLKINGLKAILRINPAKRFPLTIITKKAGVLPAFCDPFLFRSFSELYVVCVFTV